MPNRITVEGKLARMELTQGQVVLVDTADLPLVTPYTWWPIRNVMGGYYVTTRIDGHTVYMHRLIMGVTDPQVHVDHRFHNTLDNRRHSLRTVTNQQNIQNRKGANRNNATGLRGIIVERTPYASYYRATVMVDGKTVAKKRFLYWRGGLEEAVAWIREQRQRLMPYAQRVEEDIEAALAQAPIEKPVYQHVHGTAHPQAKLAPEDIPVILELRKQGLSYAKIGAQFGVSAASARQVVKGKTWVS